MSESRTAVSESQTATGETTERRAARPVPMPFSSVEPVWDVSARPSALGYFFTGIWLIYLISPVSDLFAHHRTALGIAGGLAIAVAFCAFYIWMIGSQRYDRWFVWGGVPALFALALLGCVVYGQNWITMWIYVAAASGYLITVVRRAVSAVLVATGCFLVTSWTTHANSGNFFGSLLPVIMVGLVMIGVRRQSELMHELSLARDTVAKMAAGEERLRLARDMHDLTGQSLSMVTLKSELLGKLLSRLPESPERDLALTEAADISRVSRQTLHDIREAVSGYRRPTLAIEIITARSALEAAGVELDDDPALTLLSGTFDPDAEAALAWCLREAVTNVIRHSGAKHCTIRLTRRDRELSLEVTDDGHGLPGPAAGCAAGGTVAPDAGLDVVGRAPAGTDRFPVGPAASATSTPDGRVGGSGLHGMAERLTSIGGRLFLGHQSGGRPGLRLTAVVPETPVRASQEEGDGVSGPARDESQVTSQQAPPRCAGAPVRPR